MYDIVEWCDEIPALRLNRWLQPEVMPCNTFSKDMVRSRVTEVCMFCCCWTNAVLYDTHPQNRVL